MALQDSPEIDRLSLLRHLVIGFYTGPYSMFKEIRQLPPGSTLTFAHGCLTIRRYWRLADGTGPRREAEGEREGSEELREGLRQAVASHLVSDVPVGLTLSGGLDSSILALLMTDHVRAREETPLHAYTVGYGDPSDEIPFARLMTAALPLRAHEKLCRPAEAIERLPAILWHLEEPLSNITSVTAYHWAEFMARDLKVTLIGEGADETLGGYFQYRLFTAACSLMPAALGARLFRYACLQPPLALVTALLGGGREVAAEVRHVYHDEYLAPFAADGGGLRAALRFDIEHQLPNNQLLRVDRLTMAHSLEARVPYLCHHLVESAWAFPDDWKIRGPVQKYLLRRAFQDRLAKEIIARPKIGPQGSQAIFPILFQAGLFRFMEHILLNAKASQAWFDRRVVKALLNRERGVYPILGDRVRDKLLYAMFLFVIWHRLFMEKRIAAKGDVPSLTDLAADC
jgi:asparagine synthase (glutamine-hydrolysing)